MIPYAIDSHTGHVGLMVLPLVSLFPGSLLPLHIFEPRYREMVSDSLVGSRIFGIAHATDDISCEPIGSLGIIRACVANPDGTSNLILQGIARVELSNFTPTPYPSADYLVIPESEDSTEDHEALHLRTLALSIRKLVNGHQTPDSFEDYIVSLTNAAAFTDAVAAAFVDEPLFRRKVFLETNLKKRMRLLLDFLEENKDE